MPTKKRQTRKATTRKAAINKADTSKPKSSPALELGTTGLERSGGLIQEEFLNELKGDRRVKIFREMRENDATIGAILFVVEMLVRNVGWRVEAFSDDPEDVERADFLDSCRGDMSASWEDTISEILSFLPFGWSLHELVYKRRLGPNQKDPSKRSKFSDGRVGWRKIPIRSQESLARWHFDESGGVQAMVQQDPVSYQELVIPIEKSLLFRTTTHKGNPEGRSILRSAYRPWSFKKRIENIEAIGMERDLAGMPIALVPPRILSPNASAAEKRMADDIKKIVVNIRRDEQEGIVFPHAYDSKGNPLYKIELLSSGGQRQFNTDQVKQGYRQEIATTVVADFILLGQQAVGSFALSENKTEIFATAIGAWLKSIASVFNDHAVPRLWRLNGWSLDRLPKLVPGDLESRDLTVLSTFVANLVNAGVISPTLELENFLLEQANLPGIDTGEGEGQGGSVFDNPEADSEEDKPTNVFDNPPDDSGGNN